MDQAFSDPFSGGEVPAVFAPPVSHPWYHWRRWGWNFLTFSILLHLLFGVGAVYYIVATIHPQRKQDFLPPGPKGPNASTRALEHQVQMAKKQSTMSAPVAVKRVTTTGLSRTALPAMPAMPKMDAAVMPAVAMSGMSGSGMGLGGFGNGGGGGGGGGGGALSLFGVRTRTGGSLVGHLYDLKQDRSRRPTNMTPDRYLDVARQFVQGGFREGTFAPYFQASSTLYATQLFTPNIGAAEAPEAFGVEAEVQPLLWMAVYTGRVIPTESGTYKFVGFGDDMMVVRFNNRVVLDSGFINPSGLKSTPVHFYNIDTPPGDWYFQPEKSGGHKESLPCTVEAGKPYDLQILVGEQPGGRSMFQLFLKQEGVKYQEDQKHNPILPIFRLVGGTLPTDEGKLPPFAKDGPIWKAELPSAPVLPKL